MGIDVCYARSVISLNKARLQHYQHGRKAFQQGEANYTMRHPATNITRFPINSYVWKLRGRADERHNPPTKLYATWEGPYRVLSVSDKGN